METQRQQIVVPKYFIPRPYQEKAWQRAKSGKYHYIFKLWCRQSGKDTCDITFAQDTCWWNRGIQAVYIGLDNVWIRENIWKKTLADSNGYERKHWANYPSEFVEVRDSEREVLYSNPKDAHGIPVLPDLAQSRLKFIGFLNDQQLIGSSYKLWTMSEASLYRDDAWQHIQPIWENQEAEGNQFMVCVNGTPRGMRNIYYDMLSTYTKCEDPEDFPGEHGDVFVDKKTIYDLLVPDGKGGFRRLYSNDRIDQLKDRIHRQYGNLNLFNQEYMCDFLTVKTGLVYQAIEQLQKEDRYRIFKLREDKPVFTAWDIASKGKNTDATACVIFQYIDNRMMVYDYKEWRGRALIECVNELAREDYFPMIKFGALPWDSERSASSETPAEEAKRLYPQINWHSLGKEQVSRGITLVRRQLPNMVINKEKCDRLYDAFMNYEYTFIDKNNDWSAVPKHNWASHAMDAMRYAAMSLGEMKYFHLNGDGSMPEIQLTYEAMGDVDEAEERIRPSKPSIFSRSLDEYGGGDDDYY